MGALGQQASTIPPNSVFAPPARNQCQSKWDQFYIAEPGVYAYWALCETGNVPNVYAVGDLIGPPMEMFKARKCGMTAARNIMGDSYEFDFAEYPDFLHTTYEMTWVGLSEEEARRKYPDVTVIQMPPKTVHPADLPLPCAEGTMLYAFLQPELSGLQKCVIDSATRRVVGFHHVGYGAKDAFQYLDYLMRRPEGIT